MSQFKRQFLLTNDSNQYLLDWPCTEIGYYRIFSEENLQRLLVDDTEKEVKCILLGIAVDPDHNELSIVDSIKNIINGADKIDDFIFKAKYLVGRYVIVIHWKGTTILFNDACGLKTVYYHTVGSYIYVASSTKLISSVTALSHNANYAEFLRSSHYINYDEFFIPPSCSLYNDVWQLLPNHYIELRDLRVTRFWPKAPIKHKALDEAIDEVASYLSQTIKYLVRHYHLALPLTAGYDSRTILASLKNYVDQIYIYTLKFRELDDNSDDIRVPRVLSSKLNFEHNLIDCFALPTEDFSVNYRKSVDLPHTDWEKIAFGASKGLAGDKLALKGACSEVFKCWYHDRVSDPQNINAKDLLSFEVDWNALPFIESALASWIKEAKVIAKSYNLNLLDLYVWEIKMPSWQALNQLEWDIFQDVFSPFNSRKIQEIFLGVDPKYRHHSRPEILVGVIKKSWRDALEVEFNHVDIFKYFRTILKKIFHFFRKLFGTKIGINKKI